MTEMDTHDRINLTGPWAGSCRYDLVVAHLQYRPGMAADDGGSPAAADAIADRWKALRHNGFQRRIPARVHQKP